jgi:hypothetical protein
LRQPVGHLDGDRPVAPKVFDVPAEILQGLMEIGGCGDLVPFRSARFAGISLPGGVLLDTPLTNHEAPGETDKDGSD